MRSAEVRPKVTLPEHNTGPCDRPLLARAPRRDRHIATCIASVIHSLLKFMRPFICSTRIARLLVVRRSDPRAETDVCDSSALPRSFTETRGSCTDGRGSCTEGRAPPAGPRASDTRIPGDSGGALLSSRELRNCERVRQRGGDYIYDKEQY